MLEFPDKKQVRNKCLPKVWIKPLKQIHRLLHTNTMTIELEIRPSNGTSIQGNAMENSYGEQIQYIIYIWNSKIKTIISVENQKRSSEILWLLLTFDLNCLVYG